MNFPTISLQGDWPFVRHFNQFSHQGEVFFYFPQKSCVTVFVVLSNVCAIVYFRGLSKNYFCNNKANENVREFINVVILGGWKIIFRGSTTDFLSIRLWLTKRRRRLYFVASLEKEVSWWCRLISPRTSYTRKSQD